MALPHVVTDTVPTTRRGAERREAGRREPRHETARSVRAERTDNAERVDNADHAPHAVHAAAPSGVIAALQVVASGGSLTCDQAVEVTSAIMDGGATPAQVGALLAMLRLRGETVDELTGFALAMRARVHPVTAPANAIDTCGTGGDGAGTFNISTAAAMVVAAAGIPVAKHGARAVTSRAGSADVLDALGVRVEHNPVSAAEALARDGFAFLFAPLFHPAMKAVSPVRRELGMRTCFNLLGPLTNPASVRRQVVGVPNASAASKVAMVLQRLGTERSFVIYGHGLDELPLDGTGVILDVTPAGIQEQAVDPEALGLKPAPTAALSGGTPVENAQILEGVLAGDAGPRLDATLLNAAAALVVAGAEPDLASGVQRARAHVSNGAASALLARLRHG